MDLSRFCIEDTSMRSYPIGRTDPLDDEVGRRILDIKDLKYLVDTYSFHDHLKIRDVLKHLGIDIRFHFTVSYLLTEEEYNYLTLAIDKRNPSLYNHNFTFRLFEIKWT